MIQRLWRMEGCAVGGPLHVVIDDGNYQDGHLKWVINHAHDVDYWSDEAADLGVEIVLLMLQMTGTQRRKLVYRNYYD